MTTAKPVNVGGVQFSSTSEAAVWLAFYLATRGEVNTQHTYYDGGKAYCADIVTEIDGKESVIEVKMKGSMGSPNGPTQHEMDKVAEAAAMADAQAIILCGDTVFNPAPEVWTVGPDGGWVRRWFDLDKNGFYFRADGVTAHTTAVERMFQFAYTEVRRCRESNYTPDLVAIRNEVRLNGTAAAAARQEAERRQRENAEHMAKIDQTKPIEIVRQERREMKPATPQPAAPVLDYDRLIATAMLLPFGHPRASKVVTVMQSMRDGESMSQAISNTVDGSAWSIHEVGPMTRIMLVATGGDLSREQISAVSKEVYAHLGVKPRHTKGREGSHLARWREAEKRYAAIYHHKPPREALPPAPIPSPSKPEQQPPPLPIKELPPSPSLTALAQREAMSHPTIDPISQRLDKLRREVATKRAVLDAVQAEAKALADIEAQLMAALDAAGF